mgnify:CR=1 FL=1
MAIKTEELKSGCIAKAADDEPVFVLRAQDRLAPALVRAWASLAREHGCSDEKCNEAVQLARAMEQWPTRKFPD